MRRSDLLLGMGWAATVGLGVGLLVVPPARNGADLRREIASLKSELAVPTDGPEMIQRLQGDLETLKSFGKGRMTPIPPTSDIAGLMKSLSTTLAEIGLAQRDITTRAVREVDDTSSMPVSLTLEGPFAKVYAALGAIEALPRLVRIERLQLTQPDTEDGGFSRTGDVQAELSVEAFFNPKGGSSALTGGATAAAGVNP